MRSCTDVADLRRHTEYQNGYFDQHPTVRALWQIVQDFNSEEKRAFLKFVTSCPKVKKKNQSNAPAAAIANTFYYSHHWEVLIIYSLHSLYEWFRSMATLGRAR